MPASAALSHSHLPARNHRCGCCCCPAVAQLPAGAPRASCQLSTAAASPPHLTVSVWMSVCST
jgi:hypothetical protein